MEIHVNNYSCSLDSSIYGINDVGKYEYDVEWDAPVHNLPQLIDLINQINIITQKGQIPFVAVFTPHRLMSKEKLKIEQYADVSREEMENPI